MPRQAPRHARDSGAQPSQQSINKKKIRRQTERIAEQPLAVAPEPVDFRETAVPAMPLPALQADSGNPARALADGRSHRARKELTSSHHPVAGSRQRHKYLLAT